MKIAPGISVITFLIHVVISCALPFLAFGAAMSSFSRPSNEAKGDVDAITAFAWVWTTPTMMANRVGLTFEHGLIVVTIVWSVVVAILVGMLFGHLIPKREVTSQDKTER